VPFVTASTKELGMPRNKDQKRLVRARMKKTGESYTAARAVVVARGRRAAGRGATRIATPAAGPDAGRYAAPRKEWPTLAGCGDEAVKAKTGRTWAGWVAVLDEAGAHRMSHRDIARHVAATYDVGGWWSQTVTVGYERIRGLRDVGQRRGGGYDANKSRTYAVPVSRLYRMFADARARRRWLPAGWKRVRTSIANRSIRVDWQDGTQVNLFFVPKGRGLCTVAVQHARLANRAAVAESKAFWGERLDALADALRATG
jgi:uncharacterized protein YndB with AHSA1/START domain